MCLSPQCPNGSKAEGLKASISSPLRADFVAKGLDEIGEFRSGRLFEPLLGSDRIDTLDLTPGTQPQRH
jgi:hypothetical protein